MLYEVHIPQPGQRPPRVERVHGDNWLDALRRGLAAASLPAPTTNLACDLQDDESVIITDTGTGKVFRVQPARLGANPRRLSLNTTPMSPPPQMEAGHRSSSESALSDPLSDPGEASLMDPLASLKTPASVTGDASMADPMMISSDHSEVIRPSALQPEPTPHDDRPTMPRTLPPVTSPNRPDDLINEALGGGDDRHDDFDDEPTLTTTQSAFAGRHVQSTLSFDDVSMELDELRMMGRDIHDACNFTLDVLLGRVGCRGGAIMLIKPHQRSFYFAAVRGPRLASYVQQLVPLADGVPGAALRSRRPVNLIDPAHSPLYARDFTSAHDVPPRSILCVPVFAQAKAFGMIDLVDRIGRDGFTQEDEELTTLCAQRLGDHFASLLPRRR
ncbi:MAG: GAF domain-containing protein [Bradymonadia bacterium]